MNRQHLTPAQRETMLAAINAARATPGNVSDVASTTATAGTTAQTKVNASGSPVKHSTPSRPQTGTTNSNRIPAPDFSPAAKPAAGIRTPAPPAFRLKPFAAGTAPAARTTVAPNPASAARRKAIEDAMRNGPPASNVGPSIANGSISRAGTSGSKVDGGVQTDRDPMWYDDDDDDMRPMPGRLEFDPQPNGAGASNGRAGTDFGEEVDMTEEDRFFSSPTVTQGQMMTPPSSTLKPRIGREMVDEDQDVEDEEEGKGDDDVDMEVSAGMEMDEDEDQKPIMGMYANVGNGKGKERERQRQSESMVREALEGFNWDEFEASVGCLHFYTRFHTVKS